MRYNYYNNSRYDYYNEPWRARDLCQYSEDDGGSFWARDYYNGPMDFFPRFASLIQSYFIAPMDTEDSQALHEDLIKQDSSLGSLMAVGAEKGNLPASGFYLLLASILSLVIVLVGTIKKIRKGSAVPIPNDKSRSRMAPLWLGHIPLFILTIFFTVLFSISLWPAWDHLDSHHYEGAAIQQAEKLEKFQLFKGDCEYNNLVAEGQKNLKESIRGALKDTGNYSCHADSDARSRRQLIQNDKDSVKDCLDAADHLVEQLKELKSLEKTENDLDEIEYTESSIKKIVGELKKLQETLSDAGKSADASLEGYRKHKEAFEEKVVHLIDPLFMKIDDTASRLKLVKDSLNAATKRFASWVKIVGNRFDSVRNELQRNEPLPVMIFMQVIAGVATIVSLVCLAVGFLLFGAGLAYPKGYYYCPGLLKFGRRLLTIGFVLMGFFVVALFFLSGMALRFSASSTSVCNTLTDFNSLDRGSQGRVFYERQKYDVVLKNFKGESIKLNFGELMEGNSRNGFATRAGNLHEDLIPSMRDIFDMDGFVKEVENLDLPKLDSVVIPDRNKALTAFRRSLLGLEDVDLSRLTVKRQLANLVNRELRTFKRLVQDMRLVSFNSFVISGCSMESSFSNTQYGQQSPTDQLRTALAQSFEQYREKMMSSNAIQKLYESYRFNAAYRSATSGFCIRIRLPASGVWLASMLLGTIILVNMIVVFKVSNRLCIHDEDVLTLENENFTAISTITAPLIDAKMTEGVQVYDI